ncbi:IclR family transcriptional regulator [Actinacidiphila acidipaludis]|uniref:Helix-turn-helix domain-containing protein n=1 Tax=Actinacidiphila acidipaludis TaxID=2873382 RepID=A0ABS7PZ98_9ACTN|nr:helix-turn-helix domain-containing protein [Streptomyces acidipaludis]MBY8876220.1 helix-turn-helix domain-containing protein [Streptomyces acidipaludis]
MANGPSQQNRAAIDDEGADQGGGVLVPAVSRAVRVLDTLAQRAGGATLTELADRCGLAKSTASNLLRTMVTEGLISYDVETRRYNLGPLLVEYGIAAVTRTTPVTEARPFMERLAERTELACLAIQPMPDGHFTAIAKIESRKDIKVTIEVGSRFDRTSPLLSQLADAWNEGPDAGAGDGAPDGGDVRARGFGAVFGEYRPELNVMGFPVFDRDGYPCLVIALLGIGEDLTPDDVEDLAQYLVTAARAITVRSGGRVPADYPAAGPEEAVS